MTEFVVGTVIGAAALLLALKGAVDSFRWTEDILRQNSQHAGVIDRVHRLESLRQKLENWRDDFIVKEISVNGQTKLDDQCLLKYLSNYNQELVGAKARLIQERLEGAKSLLQDHIREKTPSLIPWKLNSSDKSKKWAKFITKNKEKIDEILHWIGVHEEDLLQITNNVAALKSEEWDTVTRKFTSIDERKYHNEALNRRQDGTCQWIFDRTEYKDWLSGGNSNMLWVNASPGSGKTILSSALIEELQKTTMTPKSEKCLAYYYCRWSDPETQSLPKLFGSLAAQLSRQNLAIRYEMYKYLESFQSAHDQVKATSVSYKKLADIIVKCRDQLDRAYILIDALDEFLTPSSSLEIQKDHRQERQNLFETLDMLQKNGDGKIKILITSRPTTEIGDGLHRSSTLTMSETSNLVDIETYLNAELDRENRRWGRKLTESVDPDELRREMQTSGNYSKRLTVLAESHPASLTWKSVIVSFIAERAGGMFLWVALQLSVLFSDDPEDGVLSALDSLPPTLELTYERILKDLDASNPPRKHETTKKILLWLVAAARPLALDEINAAISVVVDGVRDNTSPRQGDPEGVIRLCGPLVRLISQRDSKQQQVSLAHFSVKEYLISGKILGSRSSVIHKYNVDLLDADLYIAKASLTYISSPELGEVFVNGSNLDDLRKEYKFLDYAILYGGTHLRPLQDADETVITLLNGIFRPEIGGGSETAGLNEELMDCLIRLLSSEAEDHGGTVDLHDPETADRLIEAINSNVLFASLPDRKIQTVYCKLFHELFTVLNDWRSKEHPLDIYPLYYASLFGWQPGVRRILESDPNQREMHVLNHALRAASVGGFVDVIDLLHQAGATVDAHLGYDLGSSIQSAAYKGNEDAVRKLLELGAHPDSGEPFHRTGGTVGSALQGAALNDNYKLVQLLIDHSADINSNKGWLGTPLQAALELGKISMAMFLIENPEFKPNVTGGYYGSASRYCCFEGNYNVGGVLKAILEKDGDPSERVGPYELNIKNLLKLLSRGITIKYK
ncbi:hypothetical protein BDV96DRAFT_558043 [Lophiotrema nucula]|uniref:Uncharacterized protein n=1 Tax=Lophiotrema nucula TaxID=690887 RepID=A0A6A5YK95_9PLEO|nr:hypothetical protein BDV96DRAFT_558043 [Lophiotrema nucula]